MAGFGHERSPGCVARVLHVMRVMFVGTFRGPGGDLEFLSFVSLTS